MSQAAVDGRAGRAGHGWTSVAWAAGAGVAGSVLSVVLGWGAAAVTMDPDQGATFIAIWFWLAGPPVSAFVMAAAARWRNWDPSRVRQSAAVTFAVCVLCGLLALSATSPPSSSPAPDSPSVPARSVP